MKKLGFIFGIHCHQPVGNFDHIFEMAATKAYEPFLEALERHPQIKISLHFSGILLDWILSHKKNLFERLLRLADRGQAEILGGAFYEPILPSIPAEDQLGQIQKQSSFIKRHFGGAPQGMWLAERVWEPHLAGAIARAGLKYTILDDAHFLSSGLREEDLSGYFTTEEEGMPLALFPISKKLRYAIPFAEPQETIELFSKAAADGKGFLVMADDGEKFGIWPKTHKHCYEDGWLERFLALLDKNRDWLTTFTFSEALERFPSRGILYIPTASYFEMSHWALPVEAAREFENLDKSLGEDKRRFLRGGFWRNFLAKYPEANWLHKRMLQVSKKVAACRSPSRKKRAQDFLWRSQCNCAFWHGVFGGLYLPHLRQALYQNLLSAEEEISGGTTGIREQDINADGRGELILASKTWRVFISPHQGGGIFEMDLRPARADLCHVLARRPEAYHRELSQAHSEEGTAKTIHGSYAAKEPGLAARLFTDWHPRASLLEHFLDDGVSLENFSMARYPDLGDFTLGAFEAQRVENGVMLGREGNLKSPDAQRGGARLPDGQGSHRFHLEKTVCLVKEEVRVHYRLKNISQIALSFRFASEWNLSLSNPEDVERCFIRALPDEAPKRYSETFSAKDVSFPEIQDVHWKIHATFEIKPAGALWAFPVETVSLSEGGFERKYQGSCLAFLWPLRMSPGETWEATLVIRPENVE